MGAKNKNARSAASKAMTIAILLFLFKSLTSGSVWLLLLKRVGEAPAACPSQQGPLLTLEQESPDYEFRTVKAYTISRHVLARAR